MSAVEEVTRALNAHLNGVPIEVLKEMKRMMGHTDDDVGILSARELQRVDHLALANQQLTVIVLSAFCQPRQSRPTTAKTTSSMVIDET